jgi:hypothetical protein
MTTSAYALNAREKDNKAFNIKNEEAEIFETAFKNFRFPDLM